MSTKCKPNRYGQYAFDRRVCVTKNGVRGDRWYCHARPTIASVIDGAKYVGQAGDTYEVREAGEFVFGMTVLCSPEETAWDWE